MCSSLRKRPLLQNSRLPITEVFILSKDALKTNPVASMGGKPEWNFLSLPALSLLHTPACPSSRLQEKSKNRVKVGLQEDSARPMAPPGAQAGFAATQGPVGQEALQKPYSPCVSPTGTQKGRQTSEVFSKGKPFGDSMGRTGAAWGRFGQQQHVGNGEGEMGDQGVYLIGFCLMTSVIKGWKDSWEVLA